jgi:hypothetical protein
MAEAHLAGCSVCARYLHIVEEGVAVLRALPAVEPSEDFLPRLQHRLYGIQNEYGVSRRNSSGTSLVLAMALAVLIALGAWLPVLRPRLALVELPPTIALTPDQPPPVPSLFRTGPLLTAPPEFSLLTLPAGTPVYYGYTPLRLKLNSTEESPR